MTEAELLTHFEKQPNGMWAVIKPITIGGATMNPGAAIGPGALIGGVDVYATLEKASKS